MIIGVTSLLWETLLAEIHPLLHPVLLNQMSSPQQFSPTLHSADFQFNNRTGQKAHTTENPILKQDNIWRFVVLACHLLSQLCKIHYSQCMFKLQWLVTSQEKWKGGIPQQELVPTWSALVDFRTQNQLQKPAEGFSAHKVSIICTITRRCQNKSLQWMLTVAIP